MATLSNTPLEASVLRLEARKSFAFDVELVEPNGAPVDLSGSTVTLTVGSYPEPNVPPVVVVERAGVIDAAAGRARIALQAAELDLDAGAYPFVIVLRSGGYSLVIVKGEAQVQENPELGAVGHVYAGGEPVDALQVRLRGAQVIRVTSLSGRPGGAGAGLDATGVAAGERPTALGDGTWEWRPGNEHEHSAAQLTSGILPGARIGNFSIFNDQVVLPTAENLIPNGMFETGTTERWDPWLTWDPTTAPPGRAGSLRSQPVPRTLSAYEASLWRGGFELEQGVEYDFELWVRADKPLSKMYVEVRDDTGALAMTWYSESGISPSTYPMAAVDVPTTWTLHRSRGVPRSTATGRAQLSGWYFNHSSGTERAATIWVGGVRLRRRVAPVTLVESTLVTAKTYADTAASGTLVAAKAYTDAATAPSFDLELGANVDLNGFTTPGTYWQSQNAEASTALNYPAAIAGRLEVYTNNRAVTSPEVIQIYTSYRIGYPDGREWKRSSYLDSWGPWLLVAGHETLTATVDSSWGGDPTSWSRFGTVQLVGPTAILHGAFLRTSAARTMAANSENTLAQLPAGAYPARNELRPTNDGILAGTIRISTAGRIFYVPSSAQTLTTNQLLAVPTIAYPIA